MAPQAGFREKYGPWALVTGASSGIGEQLARAIAAEGLDVLMVARRSDRLEAIAAELRRDHGVEAESIALDLAMRDFVGPLLAACEGKDVGLVVSNAGLGAKGTLQESDVDHLAKLVDVNCRALVLLAHAFAPRLIARGRGGLLVTASIEAYSAFPYSATYAATKAFDRSFGEALWAELRQHGIDVLVLSPGATDTDILPSQGLMRPEDVARQALDHLGSGPSFVPGVLNRLLVRTLGVLPARLGIPAAGWGMQGAIEQGKKKR
jgi:short-subunit dehydrogenase